MIYQIAIIFIVRIYLCNGQSPKSASIYPLPHFQEISPCSCDLTEQRCDVNCCCDQDCTESARTNMTCMGGLEGGVNQGFILDGNCTRQGLYESDSFPLLCLQIMNSPYLGHFYEETPHSTSLRAHMNVIDRVRKRSSEGAQLKSFPKTTSSSSSSYETHPDNFQPLVGSKGYRYGSAIKTVYDYTNGIYGHVQIPTQTGSNCEFAPVRFLKDSHAVCRRRINPERCAAGRGTSLDYQMFLIHPPVGVPIANVPEVLKRANSRKVADLVVNYFKMTPEEDQNPYLRRQTKSNYYSNSRFKKNANFERDDFGRTIVNLTDNKFAADDLRSQVYFDNEQSACINTVVESRYRFYWKGFSIEKVEVDLYLSNLTLVNQSLPWKSKVPSRMEFEDFMQFFSVKFIHFEATTDLLLKSGEPGYDPGKPLILASESENNLDVDIQSFGLNYWKHETIGSLCKESALVKVSFLDEIYSGCYIQLEKSNFSKCHDLRQNVYSMLRSLVSGDRIAKGGSLNRSSEEYIPVIFDEEIFSSIPDLKGIVHQCFVPHHMHVEIMYTRSSKRNSDKFGIYRVCGAKVSWTFDRWSWSCLNPQACRQSQLYPLTMSVEQFEVPVVWHYQNTSKFWVLQDWGFCRGDQCWNELMFPFTHGETGDEIAYAAAWGILLIPTIVFLIWFLRDEW